MESVAQAVVRLFWPPGGPALHTNGLLKFRGQALMKASPQCVHISSMYMYITCMVSIFFLQIW